ncbi:sugar phosphate nucleotidyltransferase [Candidatus Poseidoniales archaeon]|jgi:glucose-1-phosphate thymidylyltransferase|nr:sugar phosphate nucleotidyltransferase [Candidatus Poseidoniales archaeon]MDA8837745.1 sugar phosphate nucleotidyltransferase [Candidatus Poseidoniales archaeon]MDA9571573.1 sugar phosphate nucleotidyltransferase [Candidatus Poseidoniales archaeon]
MKVKAILLAGGHGSRLYPFTKYTQKTLLPLHNRPVIDYALGTIRRAGITDITIVSNQFIGQITKHVGAGLPDERIHYVLEEEPTGVADALNLARAYNEDCRLLIYFSDNITTVELTEEVGTFSNAEHPPGCILLARQEANPQAFGVAVLGQNGEVVDIVEKPENPPSDLAIGGIYMFDEAFWSFLDLGVEEKGEDFSITDVNRRYIQQGMAKLITVGEDTWVDCGTPDSLLHASNMAKDGKLNPNPFRT